MSIGILFKRNTTDSFEPLIAWYFTLFRVCNLSLPRLWPRLIAIVFHPRSRALKPCFRFIMRRRDAHVIYRDAAQCILGILHEGSRPTPTLHVGRSLDQAAVVYLPSTPTSERLLIIVWHASAGGKRLFARSQLVRPAMRVRKRIGGRHLTVHAVSVHRQFFVKLLRDTHNTFIRFDTIFYRNYVLNFVILILEDKTTIWW